MTLHWWMHWFWVTAQFLAILGSPLPSTTTEPRSHPVIGPSTEIPSVITEGVYTVKPSRQSFRVAKAIGLYPPTNTAVMPERQVTTVFQELIQERGTTAESDVKTLESPQRNSSIDNSNATAPRERVRSAVTKKDSKITWILTGNKTGGRSKYEQEERLDSFSRNATDVEDLTVLPLQEEVSKLRLVLNGTRPSSSFLSSSSSGSTGVVRTFNRSDEDVEIDEEIAEPQLLATAASILEVGVSESTRLSRARSAFTKEFQRDQVQGDNRADYTDSNSSESTGERTGSSRSAVDIAAITGSCLATVVLLSTMGSLGFIMYRRRYLNPPQTLNSDKCSNPDSSGYIDDSTIRDNSEEMYSLDNDSFLNSLEAMTIQNYWTDSVKHTKL